MNVPKVYAQHPGQLCHYDDSEFFTFCNADNLSSSIVFIERVDNERLMSKREHESLNDIQPMYPSSPRCQTHQRVVVPSNNSIHAFLNSMLMCIAKSSNEMDDFVELTMLEPKTVDELIMVLVLTLP